MLAQLELTNLDISEAKEIITYTNSLTKDLLIIIRATISNLVGAGQYKCQAYINDDLLYPDIDVVIDNDKGILHSRQLILKVDETLTVTLQGLPEDSSANVLTEILNVTPPTIEEVVEAINNTDFIIDSTQLNDVIIQAIGTAKQRVVLGPCARNVVQMPRAIR